MEASGRLVGPPVFKTGEGSDRPLAGSIPVRLRQFPPLQGEVARRAEGDSSAAQAGSIEPLMGIVFDLAFLLWRSR